MNKNKSDDPKIKLMREMSKVDFPHIDELTTNICNYIKSKSSKMKILEEDVRFCCKVYATNTSNFEIELAYLCSKINHSCIPNVSVFTNSDGLTYYYAIKDVNEGDQLFRCYNPQLAVKEERNTYLKK